MPFTIKYHGPQRLYSVRWSGRVTKDDVRTFFKTISGCDWLKPGLDGLYDYRDAQVIFSETDTSDLMTWEYLTGEIFGPGLAVSIVVDDAARNLVNAIAGVSPKVERTRISVEDLPSALSTLGLPHGTEIGL
jgi:hypothetical protein